jgi:murein DD-endopeptidase MepM/ murein hydrolase activator NlpD
MVFFFALSFVQTAHFLKKRQSILKLSPKGYRTFPNDMDSPSEPVGSDPNSSSAVYAEKTSTDKSTYVLDRSIEKSLGHTLSGLPHEEKLVDEVTRIFEPRIDFRKLRKGDRIAMAFDKEIVDGRFSDVAKVRAVRLNHRGRDFYAFYFGSENGGGYYDEKGRSLKSPFLVSPVSMGRITSRFSRSRLHPVLGKYAPHLGIDYAAPIGTPIVSIADGVVQEVKDHRAKGKFVRIKHSDGYETEYFHMSRFEKGISQGLPVRSGQIIGYVGATGIATGPHVELRLMKNGHYVDPSMEKSRFASMLPAPFLACFRERAELFKEFLENEECQNTSEFHFRCGLEKEPGPIRNEKESRNWRS